MGHASLQLCVLAVELGSCPPCMYSVSFASFVRQRWQDGHLLEKCYAYDLRKLVVAVPPFEFVPVMSIARLELPAP